MAAYINSVLLILLESREIVEIKSNKNKKMSSFKSNENIYKKEVGHTT